MRIAESRSSTKTTHPVRRDGWTAGRQLAFLGALARTRSVTAAAAAAGMSRESAYRLRARGGSILFAALWDRALAPDLGAESHKRVLSNGALLRLLSNSLRRKNNGFGAIGLRRPAASPK